jgi:hypothetical protein
MNLVSLISVEWNFQHMLSSIGFVEVALIISYARYKVVEENISFS